MFDLEDFLYCFCYFDAICTKTIEMAVGVRGGYGNPTLRAMHSIYF